MHQLAYIDHRWIIPACAECGDTRSHHRKVGVSGLVCHNCMMVSVDTIKLYCLNYRTGMMLCHQALTWSAYEASIPTWLNAQTMLLENVGQGTAMLITGKFFVDWQDVAEKVLYLETYGGVHFMNEIKMRTGQLF